MAPLAALGARAPASSTPRFLPPRGASLASRGRAVSPFRVSPRRASPRGAPRRARGGPSLAFARLGGVIDVAKVGEVAGNAAVAAVEVSKAVRMRGVDAPDDTTKSFVARGNAEADRDASDVALDEEGLPLVYDRAAIQAYWAKQGGALQKRWAEFLGLSVPFLTRVATLSIAGGAEELSKNDRSLARDARVIIEKLGPTYIKAGQMMSVRPDVLPQAALDELAILQDAVKPFETATAIATIERELGGPLGEFFDEISEQPVAAASLAQVYRARLAGTDTYVAVKVQRPQILSTVSKDLYVLRRAAEVYQGLIERFAPQQRTDYVALLNEWAVGFYTELDFLNEADNQQRCRDVIMDQEKVRGVYVPKVYHDYCTRRVLVTEWIDGEKLSDCPKEEIRELIGVGQECFLVQLLQVGFFHSDPHPGNLMKAVGVDPNGGPEDVSLVILDFGLMATIEQEDMDTMVSSIIHLANKDYPQLVDDFVDLKILPPDCDRAKVIPLMDKALSPYVKGGGAKKYEAELKRMYNMEDGTLASTAGGFQAMTQDLLTVLNDIPFSIPPYFALLGRAVVTLEGIALIGNPDYKLVMEAYPFVARKLLREDRPSAQRALQEVLYASTVGGGAILQGRRLAVMLNSAMGVVARDQEEGVFVDLDTVPEDGVTLAEGLRYVLSPGGEALRNLLEREATTALDVLLRQALRKSVPRFFAQLPRPPTLPFPLPFAPPGVQLTAEGQLPNPEDVPGPFLVPSSNPGGSPAPVFASPAKVLDAVAPRLSREEELFALALGDLAEGTLGSDVATLVAGDAIADPGAIAALALDALANGAVVPGGGGGFDARALAENPQFAAVARGVREQLRPAKESGDLEGDLGGSAAASSTEEIAAALGELTAEERATLDAATTRVLDAAWAKIVARLEAEFLEGGGGARGASGEGANAEGVEGVRSPAETVVASAR